MFKVLDTSKVDALKQILQMDKSYTVDFKRTTKTIIVNIEEKKQHRKSFYHVI
jgi:hypothetical protein